MWERVLEPPPAWSERHQSGTFVTGLWEMTLGRSGSWDFSVHPRCFLWEHRVRWFFFVFSLTSRGTHCSVGHQCGGPHCPRQAPRLACMVESTTVKFPFGVSTGRTEADVGSP